MYIEYYTNRLDIGRNSLIWINLDFQNELQVRIQYIGLNSFDMKNNF